MIEANDKPTILLRAIHPITLLELETAFDNDNNVAEFINRQLSQTLATGNKDRFKLKLKYLIHVEPLRLMGGSLPVIPKAKLCALLMLSKPEEYEGGEQDGEKLDAGSVLFFQPQDAPTFSPVTKAVCKVYYFVGA